MINSINIGNAGNTLGLEAISNPIIKQDNIAKRLDELKVGGNLRNTMLEALGSTEVLEEIAKIKENSGELPLLDKVIVLCATHAGNEFAKEMKKLDAEIKGLGQKLEAGEPVHEKIYEPMNDKLQNYSSKMNEAYELAIRFLKKAYDTKPGIVQTMR